MKFLIILGLMCGNVLAKANKQIASSEENSVEVHKVKKIDYRDGEAAVYFSDSQTVVRMPANAGPMPCLENSLKSHQQVILQVKRNTNAVSKCRLYVGGILKI